MLLDPVSLGGPNLLVYSDDSSQSDWTKTGVTAAGSISDPDSGTSGFAVTNDDSANGEYIAQTAFSSAPAERFSLLLYVRAGASGSPHTTASFRLVDDTTAQAVTGTIVSGSGSLSGSTSDTVEISSLSNATWTLLRVDGDVDATATNAFHVRFYPGETTTTTASVLNVYRPTLQVWPSNGRLYQTTSTRSGLVSQWNDSGLDALHAVQATQASQPLDEFQVSPVSAGGAGRRGADFDGVDDYLASGSASDFKYLHDGTGCTIAMALRANGDTAAGDVFLATANATGQTGMEVEALAGGTLRYHVYDGTTDETQDTDVGDLGGWPFIGTAFVEWESGRAGDDLKFYVDGTLVKTTAAFSAITPASGNSASGLEVFRNTGSTYLSGRLYALCLVKRVLTAAERTLLSNWMNARILQEYFLVDESANFLVDESGNQVIGSF